MNAELLSPAGDMEKLRFAVEYGANAVYLAGAAFGMRAGAGNFDENGLREAVRLCRSRGVKAYITVNTLPRQHELDALPGYLEFVADIKADAVIAADAGVIGLIKRHAPNVALHISTQAGVVNHLAAGEYYNIGAQRVVLARELTLDEIADIRAKAPRGLQIEAFVHGAMCVSWSGRCLLSAYMAGRDPNRGACAQPCRWKYRLEEEKRKGEYLPIVEDDTGTYVFNSKDMCMIEHLPKLESAGVSSFKIEGRAKTFYYAAVVTGAYRQAIEYFSANPGAGATLPQWITDEVYKVSHREYYTGFYFGDSYGVNTASSDYIREWDVCAIVESCDGKGSAVLTQKNKFSPGDRMELVTPGQAPVAFVAGEMRDAEGNEISCAPHPHMCVRMNVPREARAMSLLRRQTDQYSCRGGVPGCRIEE